MQDHSIDCRIKGVQSCCLLAFLINSSLISVTYHQFLSCYRTRTSFPAIYLVSRRSGYIFSHPCSRRVFTIHSIWLLFVLKSPNYLFSCVYIWLLLPHYAVYSSTPWRHILTVNNLHKVKKKLLNIFLELFNNFYVFNMYLFFYFRVLQGTFLHPLLRYPLNSPSLPSTLSDLDKFTIGSLVRDPHHRMHNLFWIVFSCWSGTVGVSSLSCLIFVTCAGNGSEGGWVAGGRRVQAAATGAAGRSKGCGRRSNTSRAILNELHLICTNDQSHTSTYNLNSSKWCYSLIYTQDGLPARPPG